MTGEVVGAAENGLRFSVCTHIGRCLTTRWSCIVSAMLGTYLGGTWGDTALATHEKAKKSNERRIVDRSELRDECVVVYDKVIFVIKLVDW